jgi:bacterial/archaeal transporter family-2 protein
MQHKRLDILAAISGVMIALQARANGELSHRLDNGLQAALVSFGSGLIIIVAISIFNPSIKKGLRTLRKSVSAKQIPSWTLFAGMLGGSAIAVQTQIVPLVGVAIYSVASIAGQSATSLVVDRIGLTGGGSKEITSRRVSAALITVFAVFISVADRLDGRNLSIAAVLLGVLAGGVIGFQRALNGQINEHSQQSFTTSLLNFTMGTTFLSVLLLGAMLISGMELSPLPAGPWWIYTGGVIGVIYIAFTSTIVQHLGVLTFTLISVGGQLLGSLLIDLFSPTEGVQVSIYLVIGIILTYLGVLVGGVRNSQLKRAATE